jgi:arylsulfatase
VAVIAIFTMVVSAMVKAADDAYAQTPPGQLSLPRPDFHFNGPVGCTVEDSAPASFPQIVRPPKGAPNIVLVLLDDVGFGQFSVFGGGVPSPTMEKLAAQGLRFNRFHTTAVCSPTRAALLTGRDQEDFSQADDLAAGRNKFVYPTPIAFIPEGSSPDLKNTSFTVTAEGIIFTQGGFTAGWGFYLQKGKLVALHSYLARDRYRVESSEPVPTGKITLAMDFKYDGGGMGKGGTLSLLVNGRKVGETRVEKTTPFKYALSEGQSISEDTGSPVDFSYTPPYKFTGKLGKVTVELKE